MARDGRPIKQCLGRAEIQSDITAIEIVNPSTAIDLSLLMHLATQA
jgi:hypothetical protein